MPDWLTDNPALMWTTGIVSVAIVVASIFALPALVVRIPADYFTHAKRPRASFSERHPLVRTLLHVGKNVLGAVLMAAGVAMLLLPGQGVLALLVGFFLLDIPGKYRVEKWLVARPWVHRPLNWLRRRRGRPPMQLPQQRRTASASPAMTT